MKSKLKKALQDEDFLDDMTEHYASIIFAKCDMENQPGEEYELLKTVVEGAFKRGVEVSDFVHRFEVKMLRIMLAISVIVNIFLATNR